MGVNSGMYPSHMYGSVVYHRGQTEIELQWPNYIPLRDAKGQLWMLFFNNEDELMLMRSGDDGKEETGTQEDGHG